MAQQLGRSLLIKMESGASPTDSPPADFVTICGFRSRSFTLSSTEVDTTVPDCTDPSQIVQKTSLPGIADRTFAVTGGLFDSNTAGKAVADAARLGETHDYQVIVPGYGTFTGPFIITDFAWSGEMEGAMEFSATWKPTGPLSFAPEV